MYSLLSLLFPKYFVETEHVELESPMHWHVAMRHAVSVRVKK